MKKTLLVKFGASCAVAIFIIAGLQIPLMMFPGAGPLLNPMGGIWNQARTAVYPPLKVISFSGYSGTVYRENNGIPHIFGDTFDDLAFMMGYLQAQDRLFAMDMQRRLIAGRVSELVGPDTLGDDKFARLMGWARSGRELWNKVLEDAPSDAELQEIISGIEAYVDGINLYIEEVKTFGLPIEYLYLESEPEPWTSYDVISLLKYQSYSLGFHTYDLGMTSIRDRMGIDTVYELVPSEPYDFEKVVIPDFVDNTSGGIPKSMSALLTPESSSFDESSAFDTLQYVEDIEAISELFDEFDKFGFRDQIVQACSNNWVVNGSLTNTGYPMLANDPHLPLILPSVWWEFQFVNNKDPEQLIYGVSFPGTPVAEIGHTAKIAWGATVTAYDQNDFYIEEMNGTHYLFNSTEWKEIEKVTEIIKIKGQDDYDMEVRFTRHNYSGLDDFRCPVIDSSQFGHSGYSNISIKWIGYAADYGILKGFFRLNKAKNINDYMDAMRVYGYPGQNFVFADVEGNIAMFPKSNNPVRNATGIVKEGRFILNGSNGEDEWTGYIPFEWIPHKINPNQMFLASTNQRSVNTSEYTKYYTQYAADISYRARRINQLLENESNSNQANGTTITVEKMKAFQTDYYDVAAEVFVPFLLTAFYTRHPGGVNDNGPTELLNNSIEILKAWNASADRWVMDKNLIAPTIFDTWLSEYQYETFEDEFRQAGVSNRRSLINRLTDCLENLTRMNQSSQWFDDVYSGGIQNATDIMLDALDDTISQLQSDLGLIDNWLWGNYHVMNIEYLMGIVPIEEFNIPDYGCSGSSRTLNVASGHSVEGGPSMRMIVDFKKLVDQDLYSGLLVVPGGPSGNPISPFYDNGFELWKDNDYHQILFPRSIGQFPTSELMSTLIFN